MDLGITAAAEADAPGIVALRNAVAGHLTVRHGKGHWSHCVTERGVLFGMKTSRVFVARDPAGGQVATYRLATKKPWAIDRSYFTAVPRPLYLLDMAVAPAWQHEGCGRALVEHARQVARDWPAQAIRLDAYDAEAGAGGFYARCGFREVGRVTYRGTPLVYFEWLV